MCHALPCYHCFISSEIIDSPEGIIVVELNSTITFTCRGNGSVIIWLINSTLAVTENGAGILVHTLQYANCIAKRNMTVYASPRNNNLNIACSIDRNGDAITSKPALLIVLEPGKHWQ